MGGALAVVVVMVAVVGAGVVARREEVLSWFRRVGSEAQSFFGQLAPEGRGPSLGRLVTKARRALEDRVQESRLPSGFVGGRFEVWFGPEVWLLVVGRRSEVIADLVGGLAAMTGLSQDAFAVVLKCDERAEVDVRVAEMHLPPRTQHAADAAAKTPPRTAPQSEPSRLLLVDEMGRRVAGLPADERVTVGRGLACSVVLADMQVSEQHLSLTCRGADVDVVDLGSSNGTFVNGAKLDGVGRAFPGDSIRVGRVRLRLVDTQGSRAAGADLGEPDAVPQHQGGSGAVARPGRRGSPPGTAPVEQVPRRAMSGGGPPVSPGRPSRPVAGGSAGVGRARRVRLVRTVPAPVDALPRRPAVRGGPVVLGWDGVGDAVKLDSWGDPTDAGNGHVLVYGASGMGKSQWLRAVVGQAVAVGMTACVVDQVGEFTDLAGLAVERPLKGMHHNPLCPPSSSPADEERTKVAVVEAVVGALRSRGFGLGHRQTDQLRDALDELYAEAAAGSRWPTLQGLHGHLSADLRAAMGELTGREPFGSGGPLGNIVLSNTVVDLTDVPGTATLQILIIGLILASLDLRLASLPPASGPVEHLLVLDEADRVSAFGSLVRVLREARTVGVGVVLASQQPQDLPDLAHTVAGTAVCLRLGPRAATVAAGHLDGSDPALAERICRLAAGEAIVRVGADRPVKVRLAQHHRDAAALEAAPPRGQVAS